MKRGKLILSLSLMCLAIAVLCFGVLAATSVTYTISGTISYEVSDVFVKINTRVFGVTAQQDKATVIANVKTLETKALDSIADSTYKLSQTMTEYDSTSANTGNVSGINLTYGGTDGYYTYYIVINIKNLSSSKDVYARVTDNTTAEVNSIKTTNLYQNAIKSTETKNIVIAYSIKDKTSSITSAAISYSLKVSYETTAYTNPVVLVNDTQNSEYYLSLGTYTVANSGGTKSTMRWKLISLDGKTKYSYTNGQDGLEARYLSGAIFIQEYFFESSAFNSSNNDGNVYHDSKIQKYLKSLETFGSSNAYGIESDPGYIESYTTDEGGTVNGDMFWLLSKNQVETFFSTGEEMIYGEEVGYAPWWTRTPVEGENDSAYMVSREVQSKMVYGYGVGAGYGVRAAFQMS